MQLTNRRPLTFYRKDASDLIAELSRDRGRFGQKIDEYTKKMADAIENAEAKRGQKGPLIEGIGGVLSDPILAPYWAEANRQPLKQKLEKFHETLVAGDPLVIEHKTSPVASAPGVTRAGKGHVLAFLTPAAPTPAGRGKDYTWNNWANEMSDLFWVAMMLDLHSYMTSLHREAKESQVDRLIGGSTELRLVGNERIRTEHNCVPRDIVSAGRGLMVFGFIAFFLGAGIGALWLVFIGFFLVEAAEWALVPWNRGRSATARSGPGPAARSNRMPGSRACGGRLRSG